MFLNAAILLLPYKDLPNPEIITQLSKLMLDSISTGPRRGEGARGRTANPPQITDS
jgi:hypothetical protein